MQRPSMFRRSMAIGFLAMLFGAAALPQPAGPREVAIEPDGTVHVPEQTVPVSGFLSPEGKAYLAEHLRNLQRPELLVQENGVPPLLAGYIARQRDCFRSTAKKRRSAACAPTSTRRETALRRRTEIACSSICTAAAFASAGPRARSSNPCRLRRSDASKLSPSTTAKAPSIGTPRPARTSPRRTGSSRRAIAPRTSESTAARPAACSRDVRRLVSAPRAAATRCDRHSVRGRRKRGRRCLRRRCKLHDATARGRPRPAAGRRDNPVQMEYFAGTDADDPLVAPASSPEVLAMFPPTLIVTGTRSFD